MTEEQALALLRNMIAWSTPPLFNDGDDQLLLDTYGKVADRLGYAPDNTLWSPTYDLNNAAAFGWDWKANKLTDRYSGSVDGQGLNRSELYDHAVARAKYYRARRIVSVPVVTDLSKRYPAPFDPMDPYAL